MIAVMALEDCAHVPCTTQIAGVVLTRAYVPRPRVLDVDFARWLMEPKKFEGNGGNRVLLVIDMRQMNIGLAVNVVCKVQISYLSKVRNAHMSTDRRIGRNIVRVRDLLEAFHR